MRYLNIDGHGSCPYDCHSNEGCPIVLEERDFYPPQDDIFYISGIEPICGYDDFYGYARMFYEYYEDDLFEIETVW